MMTRRIMLGCAALVVAVLAFASDADALTPDEAAALPDRVLGKAEAPVTIIEYASLTCGHCAMFQEKTLPQLKEKYIETGKVKMIYRDYPIDGPALKAAAVARCMPESSYHAYITLLFKNQSNWAHEDDLAKTLGQYARLGGLGQADVDACIKSDKLMDAIADGRLKADKLYKGEATPTLILNEGKDKVEGALPFEQFAAKIDALLATTTAPVAKPELKVEEKPKTDGKK